MQASIFHILLRGLSAALTVATLTAWGSASVALAPTPTPQPPTSSALPSTSRPIATTATPKAPTLDQNRIAATIQVGSPSSMVVGDGLIWVLASGSVVRMTRDQPGCGNHRAGGRRGRH
jgi:hypothetical protein